MPRSAGTSCVDNDAPIRYYFPRHAGLGVPQFAVLASGAPADKFQTKNIKIEIPELGVKPMILDRGITTRALTRRGLLR